MMMKVQGMLLVVGLLAVLSRPAGAISVSVDTVAGNLTSALTAGGGAGFTTSSAALSGQTTSSGTYTNASGTYGIGDGVVLSTGNAADYSDGSNTEGGHTTDFGANATASQEALLDPITGEFDHFDVTQLDIVFDMEVGFDTVFFNVVFGSEEFDEFVGTDFIDGFGLYINGTNIASVGGSPVNINHPDMTFLSGTELDGILTPGGNPVLTFSLFVGDSSIGNTLTFIVADTSDTILDTTVYISALGGTDPTNPVPEPGTWLLFTSGLLGLVGYRWRQRK